MTKTNSTRLLLTGLLVPFLTSVPVLARAELEHILVTGTYTPTPSSELTSTASVLDTDLLRATKKRNVGDILRMVPGVLIEKQGGPGGMTAASIRGGEANFTLVLVDGMQVNDPTNSRGGSFDFSDLDISNIERIEVVRGPQSAVYGPGALSGVINIITQRPTAGHHQRLAAGWGEDGYSHYAISATGSVENIAYSLQLSQRDSGEPVKDSTRNNDGANLKVDWAPLAAHQFRLNFRYLDGKRKSFPEQSGGPQFAVSRELETSNYHEKNLGAEWGWQVSPHWHSKLNASRFDRDEDYYSPGIYPFLAVPPQITDTNFTRDQLQWINSILIGNDYRLDVGAEYRDEEGDSNGELDFGFIALPTDFKLDRNSTGIFVSGHASIISTLTLQASVRRDDPESFNSETTTSLGAKYELTEHMTLSANWGEGFKLPSFFALGHGLVGNPGLQPETGESWDLGVQWIATEKLTIDAGYFSNNYKNLIDFDPESFTNVNRKQVETSGAELQVNWSPLTSLQLLGHATYTDIDVIDEASPLLGRPEWTAGATVLYEISSHWRATMDYQWSGEQYAASRYTGDTVLETLNNFEILDINLAWRPIELVDVVFSIDNLLDERYSTGVGFPGPGRSARISLSLNYSK